VARRKSRIRSQLAAPLASPALTEASVTE